jgi:hypothetical protein
VSGLPAFDSTQLACTRTSKLIHRAASTSIVYDYSPTKIPHVDEGETGQDFLLFLVKSKPRLKWHEAFVRRFYVSLGSSMSKPYELPRPFPRLGDDRVVGRGHRVLGGRQSFMVPQCLGS